MQPRSHSSAVLVLLRHGSSVANEAGAFGGWQDVPLSERGVAQARAAGESLRAMGIRFDAAFTSVLRRASWTLWHCLDALDQCWLPAVPDWRLNERHYGALEGMAKAQAEALYGAEQVRRWRRGYAHRPPLLAAGDARDSFGTAAYQGLRRAQVPLAESLQDTRARVLACWQRAIVPELDRGRKVLVVAHGNSIRALLMDLDGIGAEDIPAVEVPNGLPLVYRPCSGKADTASANPHWTRVAPAS